MSYQLVWESIKCMIICLTFHWGRNILHLQRPGIDYPSEVLMMRDFDPQPDSKDVPDPYYGGQRGFEDVYDILMRSNETFLNHLREKHGF